MSPRRALSLTWITHLTTFAGGAALGVAVYAMWGTPLPFDEWECVSTEAPVIVHGGGSYCAPLDGQLPEGDRWDPLGNRPFECGHRRGWVEITDGEEVECFRPYTAPPEGWSFADK